MQLDIDHTKELIKDAKDVFITPKAVTVLQELLKLRKEIDTAINDARSASEKILQTLNEQ